jgi:hypothetical protein
MYQTIKRIGCLVRLGSILEGLIAIVTFGNGKEIASYIATKMGYSSCGCDERRITMNKWTCKNYNENIQL